MPSFNFLDFILLAIIVFYALEGLYVGLIAAFLDLVSFVFSFLVGLRFYNLFANLLLSLLSIPHGFANAFGFFLAALLSEVATSILLRSLASRFPQAIFSSSINRFFGFVPGIFSSVILLSFLLTLVISMPVSAGLKRYISSSQIGSLLVSQTFGVEKRLNAVFGGAINETLNFLTVKPQSNEFVKLNFKTRTFSVDEGAEQEMFALVNKERSSLDLEPLVFDTSLRDLGRAHSKDMLERGYFSHYTPEGLSPFDRMARAQISYTKAGENLALAPNTTLAMQGLMQSPGHRANILSADFKKVGIGVIDGGIYGLMFTQEFSD